MTPSENLATDSPSEQLGVFISYSRADREIADELVGVLESQDIHVKIDRRDLPYGEEWQAELGELIRNADTVVWLVSPASIGSRWCGWELGEVARLSKRLVPVRIAHVEDETIPGQLGKIHLLPAEGTFSIGTHLPSLLAALSAHRPWLKAHTRLAERARAWADAGRPEHDLLLRGRELEDGEVWIKAAPSAAPGLPPLPQPTELQRAFLAAGRAAEETARRERTMREQAARIATGYQFSSRAQLAIDGACFDRALRLALAGIWLSRPDTPEALFEDVVEAARASRLKMEARPKSGIGAAALTPDLSLAAVVTMDGDLAVWDVESARIVARLEGRGRDGIISAAIDAEGKRIVIARTFDYADVVDARTGKLLRTLGPHAGRAVHVGLVEGTSLGFSTDKPYTIFAGKQQYFALHMWNIETGERLYTIDDFSSAIDSVLIHPGRAVFVTNHFREYLAWDIASGKRLRSLSAHVMSFAPDGQRYLTPDPDLLGVSVREWGSDAHIGHLKGHPQPIVCACWSPDGTRVATGDGHGIVGLWDAATGERQDWLLDGSRTSDGVTALRFTRDGEGLLVATRNAAAISVWNLKDRRVAAVIHGHQSRIWDIEVSADGRSFCSVAPGEALRVWTLVDSPHASPRVASLPRPSRAGLRLQRFELLKLDSSARLDLTPGVRIFGPLEKHAALDAVLARGLGDAEAFTDVERSEDPQVREAPPNPFQALRDSPSRP